MLLQASYKKSDDSLHLLKRLEEIEELRPAQVKLMLDGRSAQDQKLMQTLSASLGDGSRRVNPQMVRTLIVASLASVSSVIFGLVTLFS